MTHIKALSVAFGFALFVAIPAHADPLYDRCAAKAVTNPDYATCGGAMLDRLEASLNATWKSVYPGFPAEAKPALLDEQRLWVAFKDKSCLVYATTAFGREGQVIDYFACRARVLTDRIDALKSLGSDGQ
jgi:uncharacterized protein YecT (DUF1311 family)